MCFPGTLTGGVSGVVAAASVEPSSALLMAHSNGAGATTPVPPLGTATLRTWASFSTRQPAGREGAQGKKAVKMRLHKVSRVSNC